MLITKMHLMRSLPKNTIDICYVDAKRVIEIWRRAIFRKDSLEETVKKVGSRFFSI